MSAEAVVKELRYTSGPHAYYAQCSATDCIGYHGDAIGGREPRGPYTSKAWTYRAYAERAAKQHNSLFHGEGEN